MPPPGPPVQKVRVKGVGIELKPVGNYNLLTRDGRLQRVTPQEYRDELTKQLIASVPTLADFRARWLDPPRREQMLKELRDRNLLPEVVSEGADMEAFDEFDILAALAYGLQPMTRAQRAAKFGDTGPAWLIPLPQPTAKVIRKIVKQFEKAGTGALILALSEAQKKRRPKPYRGKCGRVYYGTQLHAPPPTFLLFCNSPELFDDQYRRYLAGALRDAIGFPDIPLKFVFRTRPHKERRIPGE